MLKVQQSCKLSSVHHYVFVSYLHLYLHLHSLPNICISIPIPTPFLSFPYGTLWSNQTLHLQSHVLLWPTAGNNWDFPKEHKKTIETILVNQAFKFLRLVSCTPCCSWYLESRLAQAEPCQVLAGWFMAWEPSAVPGSIHTLQQFICSPSVQTYLTLTHELLKATFPPVSLYLKIQIGTQWGL